MEEQGRGLSLRSLGRAVMVNVERGMHPAGISILGLSWRVCRWAQVCLVGVHVGLRVSQIMTQITTLRFSDSESYSARSVTGTCTYVTIVHAIFKL